MSSDDLRKRIRQAQTIAGERVVVEHLQKMGLIPSDSALDASVAKQEPTEIDLDAEDWRRIKEAAYRSPWMPPEYTKGDWVEDVIRFLSEPRE